MIQSLALRRSGDRNQPEWMIGIAGIRSSQWLDVFGGLYTWWNYIQIHNHASPKVRVFNPNLEEDGWLCGHTVVTILHRDIPFLVDSVRLELNRRNIAIHTIKSTVLNVARDNEFQMVGFKAANSGENDPNIQSTSFAKEALIYLEINLHTSNDDMAELARSISSVLDDVSVVVNDRKPMLAQMLDVAKNMENAEKGPLAKDIAEGREFIHWLTEHFTILGYSEYDFFDDNGSKSLKEAPKQRLGLFRDYARVSNATLANDFNEGMDRFHLTPHSLTFSKSAVRSRVHRFGYSDYVIAKRYDKKGNVCGERRFLGLYTSPVYVQSPTTIPIIREKVSQVISRSGVDPSSYDGKALLQVLETFPRDELFQSGNSDLFETVMDVARINERYMVRLFIRRDPYGKYVNCLVYLPKDVFSTRTRLSIQHLISNEIGASECEFTTHLSESILARVYLVLK